MAPFLETPKSGWMRTSATWSNGRYPSSLQGYWIRWPLKSLPTQTIQWFYEKPHCGGLVVLEAGDLLKLLLRIDPWRCQHPVLCCICPFWDSGNEHFSWQEGNTSIWLRLMCMLVFFWPCYRLIQRSSSQSLQTTPENWKLFWTTWLRCRLTLHRVSMTLYWNFDCRTGHMKKMIRFELLQHCFERKTWCLWVIFAFLQCPFQLGIDNMRQYICCARQIAQKWESSLVTGRVFPSGWLNLFCLYFI